MNLIYFTFLSSRTITDSTEAIGYTGVWQWRKANKQKYSSLKPSLFKKKLLIWVKSTVWPISRSHSHSELLRVIVQFRHNCSSVPSINWNTSVLIVFPLIVFSLQNILFKKNSVIDLFSCTSITIFNWVNPGGREGAAGDPSIIFWSHSNICGTKRKTSLTPIKEFMKKFRIKRSLEFKMSCLIFFLSL